MKTKLSLLADLNSIYTQRFAGSVKGELIVASHKLFLAELAVRLLLPLDKYKNQWFLVLLFAPTSLLLQILDQPLGPAYAPARNKAGLCGPDN